MIFFDFFLFHRIPHREEKRDDDESTITFPDLLGAPAFPWRQVSALYRNSGRATTSRRASGGTTSKT
jgi:hypothetical protein